MNKALSNQNDYRVFDNMMEGVHVLTPEWNYYYLNEAVIKQSKLDRETLESGTMLEIFKGIENLPVYKFYYDCMHTRVPMSMINEFEHPDGSIGWFELRVEPVPEGILVRSYDITEQKKLEKEFSKLNDILEFEVSERNRELLWALEREKHLNKQKSEFVTMASHNFKTPLTAILSSLALIERYSKTNEIENCIKHFKRITSSVHNLSHILNNYLSLDEHQKGVKKNNLEKFYTLSFFKEIILQLEGITKKNQTVIFNQKKDCFVLLNKKILKNIIFTLISNAIKYSNKDIVVTTLVQKNNLTISIEDKGVGIPEEKQKQLFIEFYRKSSTQTLPSSALGLNIVKHYVDLLGGKISFTSEIDKGTKFTIALQNCVINENIGKDEDLIYA
ncbi:PAS domain-containing sensor histidine kinase [Ochrovirga pacifica]|uniref:PAS domain-containing sensor histidine kinase n=1 Tax=Ochrovirga pacifica TaxID=1042376 RepID=UPI00030DB218|nr:PAS domain-containing sensor histidine kinase [Ochrovirga pacifica]